MKSGASFVNSCTAFTCFMDRSIVLSANITSRPVTALINMMETGIFCHRYLKINNSTVNEYFLTQFCGYFKDIFRIQCTCVEI